MLKMEELKPILEPILAAVENAAEIIEQIQGIDTYQEGADETAIRESINKEWNDRYMKAFFGKGDPETKTEVEIEKTEEQDEGPKTFDDLFKKED